MLFNEGTDDFFVDFNGTREADCFTYQPLDAGAEVRLLRSIRCVKILPVRYFSFGTSLA